MPVQSFRTWMTRRKSLCSVLAYLDRTQSRHSTRPLRRLRLRHQASLARLMAALNVITAFCGCAAIFFGWSAGPRTAVANESRTALWQRRHALLGYIGRLGPTTARAARDDPVDYRRIAKSLELDRHSAHTHAVSSISWHETHTRWPVDALD